MKNAATQLKLEDGAAAKDLLVKEFDLYPTAVQYDLAGALGGYGRVFETQDFQRLRTGNELASVLSALKLPVEASSRVFLAYEDAHVNNVYEAPFNKVSAFVNEKWDDFALGDMLIFDASAKWFVHIDRIGNVFYHTSQK